MDAPASRHQQGARYPGGTCRSAHRLPTRHASVCAHGPVQAHTIVLPRPRALRDTWPVKPPTRHIFRHSLSLATGPPPRGVVPRPQVSGPSTGGNNQAQPDAPWAVCVSLLPACNTSSAGPVSAASIVLHSDSGNVGPPDSAVIHTLLLRSGSLSSSPALSPACI